MSTQPAKAVTIQDLARLAGVTKSAVSVVLNHRDVGIRVGPEQRAKILALAKDLNYTPRASACALSTGKTYHIGFLLSSKIYLGLANATYATILAGVQQTCQERGYNCTVSTYDLSTLKNFVMPKKLRQRSVDGVIVSGVVKPQVIDLFRRQDIPFVMASATPLRPQPDFIVVRRDIATNWCNTFTLLAAQGHRRIVIPGYSKRREIDFLQEGLARFQAGHPNLRLALEFPLSKETEEDRYDEAFAASQAWAQAAPATRPTALVSHDQWCVGFLAGVQHHGLACPRDISILASNDHVMCKWLTPALAAIDLDTFGCGRAAAEILIDLVEKKILPAEAGRRAAAQWKPGTLIQRESVGPAPGYNPAVIRGHHPRS